MNIEQLRLQLKILLLQLRILLLRQKLTIPNLDDPTEIVVHYDGAGNSFASVNAWHRQKWGFKSSLGYYCGYHWFLQYDLRVIHARADNEEGAHCVEKARPGYWNKNAIGVCVQGSNTKFTEEMKDELKKLLDKLRIKYNIPYSKIHGHKDIKPNVCPGSKVYKWLSWYKNQQRS